MLQRGRYEYPTGEITMAALASPNGIQITIEPDHDFIWIGGYYTSDTAAIMNASDVTHGGATINVLPGTGRVFKDVVPINHVFGLPGLGTGDPHYRVPYRFVAAQLVALQLTNLVNAQQKIRITFEGCAVASGEPFMWNGIAI